MRNILLTTVILILFCFKFQAQELNFGIKGGLNLSTVAGDVPEAVNPRVGYNFGVFVNIPVSERLSLHPELLYFSIGNTYKFAYQDLGFSSFSPTVESEFLKYVQRANFLAVPVNFRFNFTKRFGLDFGPQVSFLLNSVDKIKESNDIDELSEKYTISGNFKPDYGANLGFTFSPNEKIIFQLRYYQGLRNLSKNAIILDQRSSNVALQLSAGYIIF